MAWDILNNSSEYNRNPENEELQDFMKSLENDETLQEIKDKLTWDTEFLNAIKDALRSTIQPLINENSSINPDDPEWVDQATMVIAYDNISRWYFGRLDYIPLNNEEKIIQANKIIKKEHLQSKLDSMNGETIHLNDLCTRST
jgi:hypothetical protein